MYDLIYKCRFCGEVFNKEKFNKTETTELLSENCQDIWTQHDCKDGSIGISDFQGFKKVGD